MFKLVKRAEKNMKLCRPSLDKPSLGDVEKHFARQYCIPKECVNQPKKHKRAYNTVPSTSFTVELIEQCVKQAPNNKALGEDDLPIELVKLWLP